MVIAVDAPASPGRQRSIVARKAICCWWLLYGGVLLGLVILSRGTRLLHFDGFALTELALAALLVISGGLGFRSKLAFYVLLTGVGLVCLISADACLMFVFEGLPSSWWATKDQVWGWVMVLTAFTSLLTVVLALASSRAPHKPQGR
jgi:hypothetical protein